MNIIISIFVVTLCRKSYTKYVSFDNKRTEDKKRRSLRVRPLRGISTVSHRYLSQFHFT